MRRIEIELLTKDDLAKIFTDHEVDVDWACSVAVDGELQQILTSDDV